MREILLWIVITVAAAAGTVTVKNETLSQFRVKTGKSGYISPLFDDQDQYATNGKGVEIFTAVHNKRAYCFFKDGETASMRVKIPRDSGEMLEPSRYRLVKEALFRPQLVFEYLELREKYSRGHKTDPDNLYEALFSNRPHPKVVYKNVSEEKTDSWVRMSYFIKRYDYPLWEQMNTKILETINKRKRQ